MSLDDLLYPTLALPKALKGRVPRLVILSPDEVDARGREIRQKELKRQAAQRTDNQRTYARIKANPEKLARRRAQTAEWRKANPERMREYRRKYRATEAYQRYQREWRRRNRWGKGPGQPRGELVGSAKLTEAKVREMRALYAAGGISIKNLGLQFGVTQHAAYKVVKRQSWKHVT